MSTTFERGLVLPTVEPAASERRMMLSFLIWGFSALMIGAAIGPLQALNYGGINAYPYLRRFCRRTIKG
jgi:cytochrome c oxidase subunit 1